MFPSDFEGVSLWVRVVLLVLIVLGIWMCSYFLKEPTDEVTLARQKKKTESLTEEDHKKNIREINKLMIIMVIASYIFFAALLNIGYYVLYKIGIFDLGMVIIVASYFFPALITVVFHLPQIMKNKRLKGDSDFDEGA